MSLGSFLTKFQQKYKNGLRTAYYRDVIRQQVLNTYPIEDTCSTACEIHVLTSSNDWLNLIWALKSFYLYSHRNYSLCIHADETLTKGQERILAEHFPNSRLISRQIADQHVLNKLSTFARCHELRRTNHLSPKVLDFVIYLQSERMLLLDSDVLFFREPSMLLQRIEDPSYRNNTVNADIASAYTVEAATVQEKLGFMLQERFNSGLGLIHKESMQLDWIEEFLALPGIIGHFWRIEQTIFALCSSRFGVELLPQEYDVRLDKGIHGCSSRHYVGAIRHLMYGEGMKQLMRQKFLEELR